MSEKIKKLKLKDLLPDTKNMNKHTAKGMKLLEKSIENNGMGRSILLDKDNNIVAGNATTEVAGEKGMEDVIVVEVTGNQMVAVKRMDLDINSKQGRELAMADNRVAEMNLEWDDDLLKQNLDTETMKNYGFSVDSEIIVARPKYPIVQKFDEHYTAIVIVVKNDTDLSYMETALDLVSKQSYKNTKVATGYVINVEEFRAAWEKK